MWVKDTPNTHEISLMWRAKKFSTYLSYIPGIRMIAVVNSLSMNATHTNSDIDLFIVTSPGMIWFVRFFSTLLLWSLWVWRHGADIAWYFCLSFFVTTDALDLKKIAIDQDIYLFYWIYYMKPLYDAGWVYVDFLGANTWVNTTIPKHEIPIRQKQVVDRFFSPFNSIIRFFLLPRTMTTYQKKWSPEWVIITDMMLKFHDTDKRKEVRDAIFGK